MKLSDKLQTVRSTDIKGYAKNSKKHTADQVSKIKSSLERNQYIQPIVVDDKNEIVIGHARFEAMKQIHGDDFDVEVVCVDYLSDAEVKALRILDNKLNMLTGFDDGLLMSELEELSAEFSAEDVEAMTACDFNDVRAASFLLDSKKNSELPESEVFGEDNRAGRFLLVYTNDDERRFWEALLQIKKDDPTVVFSVDAYKKRVLER